MTGAALGLALPAVALWLLSASVGLSRLFPSTTVRVALAVCGGLGLSALTTFWLLAAGIHPGPGLVLTDALVWGAIGAAAWRSMRRTTSPQEDPVHSPGGVPRSVWVVRGLFALTAGAAVVTVINSYQAQPHGDWDAWAIWNQKARFLYRGGERWTDVLGIGWSQPAHPLLLPLAVARLWSWGGSEITMIPALLGIVFGGASVATVIGALGTGRTRSWVAGAVLLAPATFIQAWTAQQADIPFAYFMVAALLALNSARVASAHGVAGTWLALAVAGALGGLAAWTKSEGLLLLLVTAALALLIALRQRPGQFRWWAAGAAPALLTTLWFRARYAPDGPYYLPDAPILQVLAERIADAQHRAVIDSALWAHWINWGAPTVAGAVPLVMLAAAAAALTRSGRAARMLLGVPVAMLAGYYTIYLVTSLDPGWLIATTFHRLLSQLWPSLVLAAFLHGSGDHRLAA